MSDSERRLFTVSDLRRLAHAVEVCASPFSFASSEGWRLAMIDALKQLLGGDAGHCSLRGFDGVPSAVASGYDSSVIDAYDQYWVDRDPGYALASQVDMTAYNRRFMLDVAGPEWKERYLRSPVWNEFYAPNRLCEGAGILFVEGSTIAHLHTDTFSRDEKLMGEFGRALTAALVPAFRAGTRIALSALASGWSLRAVLEASEGALVLVGANGNVIHENAGARSIMRRLHLAERQQCVNILKRLATDISDAHTGRRSSSASPLSVRRTALVAQVRVTAAPVPSPSGGGDLVLFTLEPVAAALPSRADAMSAGLSSREADVALLLAEGASNVAIAHSLGISVHTVRRHTERVLSKLGVTSRRDVRAHLLRTRGDMSDKS